MTVVNTLKEGKTFILFIKNFFKNLNKMQLINNNKMQLFNNNKMQLFNNNKMQMFNDKKKKDQYQLLMKTSHIHSAMYAITDINFCHSNHLKTIV